MTQNISKGAAFALLSAFAYAALTAIVKQYEPQVGTPVIIFLQSIVALIVALPFVAMKPKNRKAVITSPNKKIHFARTLFSMGIAYGLYYSLSFLPLVNSMLLLNISPLLVPFLGLLLFKKPIQHKLWVPILIGFVGVGVVLHPSTGGFNIGSLLAIFAALCMALSGIFVRFAKERGDNGLTTFFYYMLFSTILSGLASIPFWHSFPLHALWVILASGILWFIVQYAVIMSMQYVEAQITLSLYYSSIVFTALIAWLAFSEQPDIFTWSGIALIMVGGIATIRTQAKLAKKG